MTPLLVFLDRAVPLLWRATWQAAMLIALILTLRAMLGARLSPAWRYALWGVVLVRLLAPVLPASPLSLFHVAAALGGLRAEVARETAPLPMHLPTPPVSAGAFRPPDESIRSTEAAAGPVGERVTAPAEHAAAVWTLVRSAGLLWLGGVLFLSARTALAAARLRRLSRDWHDCVDPDLLAFSDGCRAMMGVPFPVQMRVTDDDFGPAVMGLWRPSVLIPRAVLASASQADLEHVMLHELAHIRRHDLAVHWLMTAACVLHWFNPAVWLASARMQADRESACDAAALRRLGRDRRSAYGKTVLKLAAWVGSQRPLPGVAGAFGGRRYLHERIAMIALYTADGRWWILVAAGLLLALVVVGLTDAVTPASADQPPVVTNAEQGEVADEPRAATSPPPERVTELIEALRATKIGDENQWAAAVRDLVKIGGPAVPFLIKELDETTEEMPLRSLGLTLREINDPRAVPALIRAIPRTLVVAGSDYGLTIEDADLLAFMQRHDLDKREGGRLFTFGMPFREITGALNAITGQRFNEEELNFISLEGGPAQRRLKRRLFHQLASRWAGWWDENWRRFTDDPTYAKVNLPTLADAPKVVAADAQPFPTGEKVRASTCWANMILGPPQDRPFYRTFKDLDTGRERTWPNELGAPEKAKADAVAAWSAREGFDLQGTEYKPAGSDRSYYALRGLGIRAWQIDNSRFGTIEADLHSGRPPELGRPAGDLLMDFDPQTGTYLPENEATFLFVTREGATGVLQITGLITELFGSDDLGKPPRAKTNRGFYRGVQFQCKLLYQDGNEGREEP